MDIYYATTNNGKAISLQKDLAPYGIQVIQKPLQLDEPRSPDLKVIAEHKVRSAYDVLRAPVAALDAGFYLYAYGGFPETYVNYTLDKLKLDGILHLMRGRERGCEFRECLAYLDGKMAEPKYFVAHVKGVLADEERGVMQPHLWSVLGLVFIPEGAAKTLAEMSREEYDAWDHQHRDTSSAGAMFGKWFAEYMK